MIECEHFFFASINEKLRNLIIIKITNSQDVIVQQVPKKQKNEKRIICMIVLFNFKAPILY